jgi:DUF1365 family protein
VQQSCAYVGWVRHRRFEPVEHALHMRLFMLYLDLDELPELFDGYRIASARGRALAEFRRSDHLGDARRPLADVVRSLVRARTGVTPHGPLRLLTGIRQFGHGFNPVSFFYCYEGSGERVQAVVAEVTNPPWGERHAYVLEPQEGRAAGAALRGRFAKAFHVSPFMGMDHVYDWRITEPSDRLGVHIESRRDGRRAFDATLGLRRAPLTPRTLARLLAAHPLQSATVLARIYWHGLRIWSKGAGYFPNPSGAPALGPGRTARAERSRERAGDP